MNALVIALGSVAVVLLLAGGAPTVVQACLPSDRAALLKFRSNLNEPYIGVFNSWKGQDCCNGWYGVSCDPTNRRVSAITLRGISEEPIFQRAKRKGVMTGSISPSICELTQLSGITLSDWDGISGAIPSCITNLLAMRHIDLVGNRISGGIPANIGNLLKLTVLSLADNQISGAIPPSITRLTSLTHLDLRNNGLTGVIPGDIGQRHNTKEATVALEVMLKKKDEAVLAEMAMRDELLQKEKAMNKELKRARELVKAFEKEKTELANEKKILEEEKAAAALEHSKEMDRLRESRRYEVTHERIRVMAAMHGKAAARFQRIRDRESRRDNFEDARCMLGQARGMRRCLEGMKAAGKNISQGDIDIYAGQEKHYDAEVKRLTVDDLLEKDLSLSPLVLESRFVIQEILDKVDKFGSNMDLLDSEAAKALRTPLGAPGDQSEGPSKSLLETVQSPARSDAVLPDREVAPRDSVAEETNKLVPDEPISNAPIKTVDISDSPSFDDVDSGASEGFLEEADPGACEEHPEEDLPALD